MHLQLRDLSRRLEEHGLKLDVSRKAAEWVAREAYDPVYGARPLKRTLQRRLLDPLALEVLHGRLHEGDRVVVDAGSDGLTFGKAAPPA